MDNDGDRKTFEVMTSAETLVTIGSMASIATYPVQNHKLWNTVSTERYILHIQVLLHINGKFTMGKFKTSRFLYRSVIGRNVNCFK